MRFLASSISLPVIVMFTSEPCCPPGGYKVLSVVRGSWPKQKELALSRITSAMACEFIVGIPVKFSLLGSPRFHRF